MSINNQLPPGVEEAARKLIDDAFFVDQVWASLAAYHDLRVFQLNERPMKDAKQAARNILEGIKRLRSTIEKNSHSGRSPYINDLENHYLQHLGLLNSIKGRNTKNKPLRLLASSFVNLFETYNVPQEKIAGFILFCLPFAAPAGDSSPEERSVKEAVASAKKSARKG